MTPSTHVTKTERFPKIYTTGATPLRELVTYPIAVCESRQRDLTKGCFCMHSRNDAQQCWHSQPLVCLTKERGQEQTQQAQQTAPPRTPGITYVISSPPMLRFWLVTRPPPRPQSHGKRVCRPPEHLMSCDHRLTESVGCASRGHKANDAGDLHCRVLVTRFTTAASGSIDSVASSGDKDG